MIIILLFCVGCSKTKIINIFNSFEVETSEQVAYAYYNTLVFKVKSLDFNELLKA